MQVTAARRRSYDELKARRLANPYDESTQNQMDPTLNNPLCPAEGSPWARWEEASRVGGFILASVSMFSVSAELPFTPLAVL